MTEPETFSSEQAIVNHFQELRNELSQISAKANDLAAESREHGLVLGALEHLDGGRKCYRVVRFLRMFRPAMPDDTSQIRKQRCTADVLDFRLRTHSTVKGGAWRWVLAHGQTGSTHGLADWRYLCEGHATYAGLKD